MAVYKVAQDVEADDKLIGPFSFRQFIYLIIVAISILIGWGLAHLFVLLAILPLPVIVFFGALALPLRKDQPMEVYMAALVSFYLKPRKRLWIPDGIESLIEITAPKVVEVRRVKDIDELEAERRLSYLADIADTRGWAVRHAAQPMAESSMISDAYFEAQQAPDVLDSNSGVAQSFNAMINEADAKRRKEATERMHSIAVPSRPEAQVSTPAPQTVPQPQPQPQMQLQTPAASDDSTGLHPLYNPYPSSIHQSVIQPLGASGRVPGHLNDPAKTENPTESPATTSEKQISPDIINLASNTDLSIETIQHEAHRIQQKAEDDGEVFVPLR